MAFGPLSVGVYLLGIDGYLKHAAPEKREAFLEQQLRVIDSLNRALDKWAHHGGGNPPSPFNAFELAQITNELGRRLANEREAARRTIAAE